MSPKRPQIVMVLSDQIKSNHNPQVNEGHAAGGWLVLIMSCSFRAFPPSAAPRVALLPKTNRQDLETTSVSSLLFCQWSLWDTAIKHRSIYLEMGNMTIKVPQRVCCVPAFNDIWSFSFRAEWKRPKDEHKTRREAQTKAPVSSAYDTRTHMKDKGRATVLR